MCVAAKRDESLAEETEVSSKATFNVIHHLFCLLSCYAKANQMVYSLLQVRVFVFLRAAFGKKKKKT